MVRDLSQLQENRAFKKNVVVPDFSEHELVRTLHSASIHPRLLKILLASVDGRLVNRSDHEAES